MDNTKNEKKSQSTSGKKRSKKDKLQRLIDKTLSLIPTHQQIHKQHISHSALVRVGSFRSSFTGRWYKRALRNAVQSRDHSKVKEFIAKGLDIHTVISDVFWDTPLTYAVKCGYLDMVELLLHIPACKVDHKDRNNHSTLDEAIKSLLTANSTDTNKKSTGNRYRIIKSLLCAGAQVITPGYLDTVLFSVINTKSGQVLIHRMVKVVAEFGCTHVKSTILSILIPYQGTSTHLKLLLSKGANPFYFVKQATSVIPVRNALCLVRYGSNDRKFLDCIQYSTSQDVNQITKQWPYYQLLLRLLVQLRLPLRLIILDYLYRNHAFFYKWMASYETQPLPLLDLCRLKVRNKMQSNMIQSVQKILSIPDPVRSILLLE